MQQRALVNKDAKKNSPNNENQSTNKQRGEKADRMPRTSAKTNTTKSGKTSCNRIETDLQSSSRSYKK